MAPNKDWEELWRQIKKGRNYGAKYRLEEILAPKKTGEELWRQIKTGRNWLDKTGMCVSRDY